MKVIQPITIWYEGGNKTAVYFTVTCSFDNLSTFANFTYQLITVDRIVLQSGQLDMQGQAYADWQTNEYAYNWAASQLNITIVGDYTTTTTTTSTTTSTTTAIPSSTTSTTTTTTTNP